MERSVFKVNQRGSAVWRRPTFVIFFSQVLSLTTTLVTGSVPHFDWAMLLLMMGFAVVGATLGRTFSRRMSGKAVDVLFMVLMAVIIGLSIYNCFRYGRLV